MTHEQYEAYIKSDKWREKKARRMAMDGFKCVSCGTYGTMGNALIVHHLGYQHLGEEDVGKDLATLCQVCHERTHNLLRRVQDENGYRGWGADYNYVASVVLDDNGNETITKHKEQ